jgi:hypothetical protein
MDPRPVLATGLRASFVSREWAAASEAESTQVKQKQFHDPLTNTTLKLYGMVDVQADDDPTFLAFIADIKTSLVLGIDYFEKNGREAQVSGGHNIMATSSDSPPVSPSRAISSRSNMLQMRSERTCTIAMLGSTQLKENERRYKLVAPRQLVPSHHKR